jgi:16S rRNA pseudouridine516 synthase
LPSFPFAEKLAGVSKPIRRLDQILANLGYCSRSEARGWVRGGRVTVNGEKARDPADKALLASVLVDGQPLDCPDGLLAILHKPAGYVCTHDVREGAIVFDILPARWLKRNPPATTVGRLDKDTTGVLLITDQGALVQRWTSPHHKVPKMYEVTVDGELTPGLIPLFAAGTLLLEDDLKPCLPAKLEILSAHEARLELVEGRYHQVKRMFGSQGLNVTHLHRSHFGEYTVADLKPGEWRLLPVPTV